VQTRRQLDSRPVLADAALGFKRTLSKYALVNFLSYIRASAFRRLKGVPL
jgi:hypothetical protein